MICLDIESHIFIVLLLFISILLKNVYKVDYVEICELNLVNHIFLQQSQNNFADPIAVHC